MTQRPAVLISILALGALALAGCGLLPNPEPSRTATPKPTEAVVVPEEEAAPLPEDAVLGLTGTATAANGAVLKISVIVRQAVPWNSTVGAPRAAATATNCDGELDASVFESNAYSFSQVDVTATLDEGSAAWPADLPIQILPIPDGSAPGPSHTAAGDIVQVEEPSPDPDNDPGYYVPHCLQNTFLNGPGSGSVYLGYDGDAAALTAWAKSYYGVTFDGFGEPTDPSKVTLSDCTQTVTPLGVSTGAPADGFNEFFFTTFCQLGGA